MIAKITAKSVSNRVIPIPSTSCTQTLLTSLFLAQFSNSRIIYSTIILHNTPDNSQNSNGHRLLIPINYFHKLSTRRDNPCCISKLGEMLYSVRDKIIRQRNVIISISSIFIKIYLQTRTIPDLPLPHSFSHMPSDFK